MSATNATTHYEFPVFVGSDKPAWLVDWNGAMQSIDSAIYEAKSTADSAVASAASIASDLLTLSGTVSTQGSSITTLSETLTTAVGNINTINGNINTINSLIGNGTPTTTDQTIIGAINEINANLGTAETSITTMQNKLADALIRTGIPSQGLETAYSLDIGYNSTAHFVYLRFKLSDADNATLYQITFRGTNGIRFEYSADNGSTFNTFWDFTGQ